MVSAGREKEKHAARPSATQTQKKFLLIVRTGDVRGKINKNSAGSFFLGPAPLAQRNIKT